MEFHRGSCTCLSRGTIRRRGWRFRDTCSRCGRMRRGAEQYRIHTEDQRAASIDDVYRIVFERTIWCWVGRRLSGCSGGDADRSRASLVTTKYNPARTWTRRMPSASAGRICACMAWRVPAVSVCGADGAGLEHVPEGASGRSALPAAEFRPDPLPSGVGGTSCWRFAKRFRMDVTRLRIDEAGFRLKIIRRRRRSSSSVSSRRFGRSAAMGRGEIHRASGCGSGGG